jgi:hypothetical protein
MKTQMQTNNYDQFKKGENMRIENKATQTGYTHITEKMTNTNSEKEIKNMNNNTANNSSVAYKTKEVDNMNNNSINNKSNNNIKEENAMNNNSVNNNTLVKMMEEEIKMNENMIAKEEDTKMMNNEESKVLNEKGFTTIELIILLALLVVLASFFKEQIFSFARSLFEGIFAFDASIG